MKRFTLMAFGLAVVLALPVVASAQAAAPSAPVVVHKAEFDLDQALVIGTQTVKPGTYKFECRTIDGKDFLIVTGERGVEVARVPCKPVSLNQKVKESQYGKSKRADGTTVLVNVRIRGEAIEHVVIANPAS